jgi:hypothetical protein
MEDGKMRRFLILVLLLSLCLAQALAAQQKDKPAIPSLPTPLSEQFVEWQWLLGEWEGFTESPMGKSTDWQRNDLGLDDQFLLMEATSEMNGMNYKGMGAFTVDPKTGDLIGYWIDNMRGFYVGKGKIGENQFTMTWDGSMGKSTRITEKVNENEFKITIKATGPDGKPMEATTVMKRKGIIQQ